MGTFDSIVAGAVAGGVVSLLVHWFVSALGARARRQVAADLVRLEVVSNMTVAALLLDERPQVPGVAPIEVGAEQFRRFAADLRGMSRQRFTQVATVCFQTASIIFVVERLRSAQPLHREDDHFVRRWLQEADLAQSILRLEGESC